MRHARIGAMARAVHNQGQARARAIRVAVHMGYLHHIVVGVPMTLLISAAGLLVLSCVVTSSALRKASEVVLLLGTGLGLLAAITGFLAQADTEASQARALATHRALSLVGLALAAGACALWLAGVRTHLLHATLFRWGVPLLAVGAAVAIGVGARSGSAIQPASSELRAPAPRVEAAPDQRPSSSRASGAFTPSGKRRR